MPKSILIVDDSAIMRKTIRRMLEWEAEWEVVGEAINGVEGIKMARRLKPDLIVLDLAMPVMNGLEAARALTRLLPSVPLMMLTNYDTPQLEAQVLSAGIRTLVSKAASTERLLSSIRYLLEHAS